MLSILLLLAAPPQSVIPSVPPPPPPAPSANGRVLDSGSGCASEVQQAGDATVGGNLMWRDEDGPVAHYRLLDRHVNGCPAPVIVNYRVPGSDAIGREAGRTPAAPVIAPRR